MRDIDWIHKLSRVAFWGVIRALQSHINICYYPPACSSPRITEGLSGSWPCRYMRMDSPNNTVCTIVCSASKPVQATSQARLHGVLGRKSMYVGQCLGQPMGVPECVNDPLLKTTSSVVAATGYMYFHVVVKTAAKSQIRTK